MEADLSVGKKEMHYYCVFEDELYWCLVSEQKNIT